MAKFYKTVVRSSAGTQLISNILYFASADGNDVLFSADALNELNDAIAADIIPTYANTISSVATVEELVTTVIDEDNKAVGFFDVRKSISVPGTTSNVVDSYAACAILALTCTPLSSTQTLRVPKRSYLALGPVGTNLLAENGAIVSAHLVAVQSLGAALVAFSPTLVSTGQTINSVRVGVPNKTGLSSVGAVVSATARPFMSFRRTRMTSPSGA